MTLPVAEIADIKLAELKLLLEASRVDVVKLFPRWDEGQAAEYLTSQGHLELIEVNGLRVHSFRITDRGRETLAACLAYLPLT